MTLTTCISITDVRWGTLSRVPVLTDPQFTPVCVPSPFRSGSRADSWWLDAMRLRSVTARVLRREYAWIQHRTGLHGLLQILRQLTGFEKQLETRKWRNKRIACVFISALRRSSHSILRTLPILYTQPGPNLLVFLKAIFFVSFRRNNKTGPQAKMPPFIGHGCHFITVTCLCVGGASISAVTRKCVWVQSVLLKYENDYSKTVQRNGIKDVSLSHTLIWCCYGQMRTYWRYYKTVKTRGAPVTPSSGLFFF